MKLLNEILGTKYPIIQGGMANIATGEFAAACSNAGALGLIGSGGMDADALRENIRRCRALTDKPFGVNIMLMHPQADAFAKIVVEEGVRVVTTGAGNPGKYMSMWKAAGITVIPVVAAVVLAKHLEPLGIDAVIAEGTESGGHVGEMTTMALVPQVVDAVSVPVIAAGGIADGRGMAAALALGACGVQVGTCLLASSGMTLDDLDWVVCHQANSRIIDHCIKHLHAEPSKFYKNMDRHGNTGAASIPIALHEMEENGLLQPGQVLACIGFGGGLSWGGMLLTYEGRK